ncbi:hypothetical protein TUM4637_40470 [Shewanella hafniensis]|nr:hypothetical protein TUM4637_40470 [Shewanella hafniensis]
MPLKALIDSEPIQSFDLAKEEWAALKIEYKQRELTMPCCGRTAIRGCKREAAKFWRLPAYNPYNTSFC